MTEETGLFSEIDSSSRLALHSDQMRLDEARGRFDFTRSPLNRMAATSPCVASRAESSPDEIIMIATGHNELKPLSLIAIVAR